MAISRQLSNGQMLTDWTEEVNDVANQFGMLNGTGLFSGSGTSQLSVIFDKTHNQILLLPQTRRNAGPATKGADRKTDTFALTLPYFLYQDYITPQDIQSARMAGTPDSPETLANVLATKLDDSRMVADQTREFMKLQAIKGITTDGDGAVIADMFDKFDLNAADYAVDFDLGNAATDIDAKIALLRRNVAKSAKTGGRIGKLEVMVTPEFYDALVNHPKIREAYLHYTVTNNNSDVVRGNQSTFMDWGVVDKFEHKGVLFYTYDATFVKDDGDGTVTELRGIGTGAGFRDSGTKEGFTIIRGMNNLYKGVFGPANSLSAANQVGSEMYFNQYTDPKDKFHELELEMANLYYMSRPQVSWRVHSTS
jgi:hypothetical protein